VVGPALAEPAAGEQPRGEAKPVARLGADGVVIPTDSVPAPPVQMGSDSDTTGTDATAAATDIAYQQVLEHGLRHLAWLATDDPAVRDELSGLAWQRVLAPYIPEPFRALG